MKNSIRALGGSAALIVIAASLGAQNSQDLRVYKGEAVGQGGLALMTWGSGEAKESEEKVYVGNRSIKVTTHGRYQGARLVLQNPVDLKTAAADPTAYLQVTLSQAGKGTSGLGGDYGAMAGGPGGMSAMMGAMRRGRGLMGGGQSVPGGEGAAGGESGMKKQKPMSRLRLVLAATDGKKMETWLPLENATTTREDWKQLSIPVSMIAGLKESSGLIKEVQIFGDTPAVLYIGEVRVVRDETPIRVDDLPERTVAVNDQVQFNGSADAGVTPLVYEWDFDNSDGVAVDKTGKSINHRFRKSRREPGKTPGTFDSVPYIVTLTVRDLYGTKKPATRTTKVLVTL